MRLHLAAELGNHVELRDHNVIIRIRTIGLLTLMNDLYLQLGYFLHAKNMVSRGTDYHLSTPVYKWPLQGCIVQDEPREVASEDRLASSNGNIGDRIVELEGVLKYCGFLDFG